MTTAEVNNLIKRTPDGLGGLLYNLNLNDVTDRRHGEYYGHSQKEDDIYFCLFSDDAGNTDEVEVNNFAQADKWIINRITEEVNEYILNTVNNY